MIRNKSVGPTVVNKKTPRKPRIRNRSTVIHKLVYKIGVGIGSLCGRVMRTDLTETPEQLEAVTCARCLRYLTYDRR
jgi:hypothetical protein